MEATSGLGGVNGSLPLAQVRTMAQDVYERSLARTSFALVMLAGLPRRRGTGCSAVVGIYGVISYAVTQRTREIGIRMALGADRGKVVGMVLHGAFRRVLVGLALGLPLAVGAGHLLSAQLYGVQFWDPLALGVGAVSLAACAFFAAIIPAARAAGISPIKALRTE